MNPKGRDKRPPQIRTKLPGVVEATDEKKLEVWRKSVYEHKSVATIAKEMDLKPATVTELKHQSWKEILDETTDATDVYRAECSAKLSSLIEKWWKPAQDDIQAATFVANTISKLAKINGCEVFRAEISGKDGQPLLPADIMMLIATGVAPKQAQVVENRRIE